MKINFILGLTSFLLFGCFPIETDIPTKAWKYWTGTEPPEEIELVDGKYYQSSHFTLEYELFLNFTAKSDWFAEFIAYNHLEIDTIRNDWTKWTEVPEWFTPDGDFFIYCKDQNDEFERSRYFYNSATGESFIYETVGM